MKLSRNNKGSSLVLVIVVLAFVGILATVALWTSLTNYQMKVTDTNVTDNFYSAEGVLDQVCVGLQTDVSDALEMAYLDVMQNYAERTEDERSAEFKNLYTTTLCEGLKYGTAVNVNGVNVMGNRLCDLKKLKKYVSSKVLNDSSVTLKNADDGSEDYCLLNVVTNGVVIKNLVVEYIGDTGDLSIIQTDILLQMPSDLNMINGGTAPEVFDYGIIANGGVEILGPGTKIKSSVYAGSQYALNSKSTTHDASITEDDYYESLVIADTANVDFTGAVYVIADGDIRANGTTGSTADTLTTGSDGELWARNIYIDKATAILAGTTNVADDLTLNGEGSKVNISGYYSGYGDADTGDAGSSAIILNGKSSILDMSGARSVVVAGYAYINTGAISTTSSTTSTNTTSITNDSNIQLGESILVKGDQIAYLVPSECVATTGFTDTTGGTSKYKKNPLTVAEYKAALADDTCKLVDENVITKTGSPLSAYFSAGQTADNIYQMILVPSKTGNPDDGLVYLYLNLSADMAKQYFLDYYRAGDEKLKKYNAFYSDGIHATGTNVTVYTAGTYADYTEVDGKAQTLTYDKGAEPANGGIGNLPDIYDSLTTKLESDPAQLDGTELPIVFENIIDKNFLTTFLADCTGKFYSTTQATTVGVELHVVLTDNEGGSAYQFNDTDSSHVYLILATGDVDINTNFRGTVIANGKVTVGNASNITVEKASTENSKRLLAVLCESNNHITANAYTFFKDGSVYVTSGLGSTTPADTSPDIDISGLIGYQNWKKK